MKTPREYAVDAHRTMKNGHAGQELDVLIAAFGNAVTAVHEECAVFLEGRAKEHENCARDNAYGPAEDNRRHRVIAQELREKAASIRHLAAESLAAAESQARWEDAIAAWQSLAPERRQAAVDKAHLRTGSVECRVLHQLLVALEPPPVKP